MNFDISEASPASLFCISAEPPEVGAGSNEVGLIVTHLILSLLFTVAKAVSYTHLRAHET